jgi:hypothetical protein
MMTLNSFVQMLSEACDSAGGVRAFARQCKVDPSHISKVLWDKQLPGPKLLKVFGLKKQIAITYTNDR